MLTAKYVRRVAYRSQFCFPYSRSKPFVFKQLQARSNVQKFCNWQWIHPLAAQLKKRTRRSTLFPSTCIKFSDLLSDKFTIWLEKLLIASVAFITECVRVHLANNLQGINFLTILKKHQRLQHNNLIDLIRLDVCLNVVFTFYQFVWRNLQNTFLQC